jgi:hypothetical protein
VRDIVGGADDSEIAIADEHVEDFFSLGQDDHRRVSHACLKWDQAAWRR